MKREELKSMFDALRHDPQHHLGLGDIRLTVAQQDLILDAIDDPLPPAEGAKEILQKYMDMSMIICPLHVVPRSVAIDAMHDFATLHAQKIADKMVSERLRGKFLLAYDELRDLCCRFFRHWWNSPGANTEEGFDTWAEMNNLKSRDNDSKS